MGLFKRCTHTGRLRDACGHPWWVKVIHRGERYQISLELQCATVCRGRGSKTLAAGLAATVTREIKAGTFTARPAQNVDEAQA